MIITPGTYLRMRREAAGLSSAEVAAMIVIVPRLPEHDLIYWLDRIEADVVPATFRTITCLRCYFSFDIEVLEALVAIQFAPGRAAIIPPPRLCRECACSERDACGSDAVCGCSWAEADLCSACAVPDAPEDPDGGDPAWGIDPDDRGDGETHRGPANDPIAQPLEIAA